MNVRVEFEKVLRETAKAKLIKFDEGVEHWIPDSVIEYIDEEDGVIYLPEWIVEEKELL